MRLILTPDPRPPLAQSQTRDDGLDLLFRERDVRTETSANDEPVVPAISGALCAKQLEDSNHSGDTIGRKWVIQE